MGRTGWRWVLLLLTPGVFLVIYVLELLFLDPWLWIGVSLVYTIGLVIWFASTFGPGVTREEALDDLADDGQDSDPVRASELVARFDVEDHNEIVPRPIPLGRGGGSPPDQTP